ncbi:unnamed protein product, partial [Sphacelaria rigidula]
RKGIDRAKATELLFLSVDLAVRARDQFWREHQQERQQQATTTPEKARTTATATATATTTTTTTTIGTTPTTATTSASRKFAKERRRPRPIVAASLGCYGAALADGSEYRGDYGMTVGMVWLREWHRERLDVLARADGVDLVMFETIPCLEEVRAILSLLEQNYPTNVDAVISISCQDEHHLRSGEAVRDFAELIWPNNASTARKNPTPPPTEGKTAEKITTPLEEALSSAKATVVGVGVNCTAPQNVAGVLHILAEAAKKRAGTVDGGSNNTYIHICGSMNSNEIALVAYPNSGEEWDAKAREWVQDTGFRGDRGALDFGRMSQDWFAAGATVLGGCCRTTPAHIQEMNEVLVSRHIT